MLVLLARTCLHLLANAVGLLAAVVILPDFSIDALSFIIVTIIFTVVEVVAGPLLISISLKNVPALTGGISLVTTFVGLLITNLVSDGMSISGVSTWVLATLIVWLAALIAEFVLPLIIFRKILQDSRNRRGR